MKISSYPLQVFISDGRLQIHILSILWQLLFTMTSGGINIFCLFSSVVNNTFVLPSSKVLFIYFMILKFPKSGNLWKAPSFTTPSILNFIQRRKLHLLALLSLPLLGMQTLLLTDIFVVYARIFSSSIARTNCATILHPFQFLSLFQRAKITFQFLRSLVSRTSSFGNFCRWCFSLSTQFFVIKIRYQDIFISHTWCVIVVRFQSSCSYMKKSLVTVNFFPGCESRRTKCYLKKTKKY